MPIYSANSPVFTNVIDYGVTGNGTTDDLAKINSALATIPTSSGGVLYFPPGRTYLVSAGIDISAYSGKLVILGGGQTSVIKLKNGANDYIIKNTSGQQLLTRISNIALDCNSANQTAASGGIYGYKYRRCLIDFVWIHNPWQAGIYLIGDPGDFGYQNRIRDCFIEGGSNVSSGVNAYGNGLRIENTDENQIYGNHFEANGNFNDGTYGFHIYDKNGLSTYSLNSFVNGAGVFKLDGFQCRITNNAFDGNGGACVQINSSAAETLISNNTIINVGFRASGGSANSINAIYLNATRCIIRGNYFESDASATPKTNSFVNIDTGGTYSMVEGNTLNVKASSGTLTAPIFYAGGAPAGSRVRGNTGFDTVNNKAIFVTENHGSASITTGNTSIVVTHGLALTPTLDQIMVCPQTTLASATRFWISGVTSTQFTINLDANPGATVTFSWRADVGY